MMTTLLDPFGVSLIAGTSIGFVLGWGPCGCSIGWEADPVSRQA